MDITSLLIEAVSGAVGGNVAGAAMKENSLGAVGNSIAGIVGGGLGKNKSDGIFHRVVRCSNLREPNPRVDS